MINDETKRKLRELNMSEIITGLEIHSQSRTPLHGLSMTASNDLLIMSIRRNTTAESSG